VKCNGNLERLIGQIGRVFLTLPDLKEYVQSFPPKLLKLLNGEAFQSKRAMRDGVARWAAIITRPVLFLSSIFQ
jgi:hypothetical protein